MTSDEKRQQAQGILAQARMELFEADIALAGRNEDAADQHLEVAADLIAQLRLIIGVSS